MKKINILFTIFAITFSTVLIEILYTRVFSVIYTSSFAFLMISLAMFGYGLSGVYLSITKLTKNKNAIKYLEIFLISYAILLPIIYKITLITDIDFLHLFNPFTNFLLFSLNIIVLIAPFFFAGASLALIFTLYSSEIGKLYFIDLIGAASGGIAIIPLITNYGPSKIIILLFLLLSLSWFFITKLKTFKRLIAVILIIFSFFIMFKNSKRMFPIVPKMVKRAYLLHYYNKTLEYGKWSPINKIDISPFLNKNKKIVWIDAGTMQSWLIKFDGNLRKLGVINWSHEAIPYQLTKNRAALIIGSSGGYEVLCALSHKVKRIIAVEMDPEICSIVKTTYANYIGRIFSRPNVKLLNDEGRSVIKRIKQKFDIIQMVNSHNADILLSGGLSIAETYIYTVESFKDYWNHLNKNGYVSIVHWFGERLFSTAFQALREMKIEHPENKFFIIQAKKGFNFFFMKKGDITKKEASILTEFAGKKEIIYSPFLKKKNIYYRLASEDYKDAIKESSVNLSPVYDNSPYFNQPNKIGQFKFKNMLVKGMAKKVVPWGLVYSNTVYLTVLFLSILLPFILIYLPLRLGSEKAAPMGIIGYFFLIGLSFIMIEIIMIKIFQLYLGNPAYSISAIISSLLIASGTGSLLSGKVKKIFKDKMILYLGIFLFLIISFYSFSLFKIISALIHIKLFYRFLITFILIFIPGFFMGMFFPTGINYLGGKDKNTISWAWGANSFATVLGSVLTIIIAINWNFSLVLFLSAFFYLSAGIVYFSVLKKSRL